MNILDEYFELQSEIYAYFGYIEDWKVIPISDARQYYWTICMDNVKYAETKEQLDDLDAGNYYEAEFYNQRFLSNVVYRGEKYTMISVDTHCDVINF